MGGAATGQAALRHPPSAAAARASAPNNTGRSAPAKPNAAAPLIGFAPGGLEVTEKITKGQENGPLLRRTCLTVAAPPRKAPTPSGEVRLGS